MCHPCICSIETVTTDQFGEPTTHTPFALGDTARVFTSLSLSEAGVAAECAEWRRGGLLLFPLLPRRSHSHFPRESVNELQREAGLKISQSGCVSTMSW